MAGTNEKTTQIVAIEAMDDLIGLFGVFDENLRVIEEETGTRIAVTEDGIRIEGGEEMTALTATVLEKMLDMQRRGEPINRSRIRYAVDLAREGNAELISQIMGDVVAVTNRGRQIKCKTLGQKRYVQALKEHELVFGVGPAGTGGYGRAGVQEQGSGSHHPDAACRGGRRKAWVPAGRLTDQGGSVSAPAV